MYRQCNKNARKTNCFRGGLTLVELVISMTILVMVAGTLGVLATGVQQGYEYAEGHGMAAQHARVAIDRIVRTAAEATANEQFPGMLVIDQDVAGWRLPDTLVIWNPDGEPADPDGLPRYNELVIYCPNPSDPNELVELTMPANTGEVPAYSETAKWKARIAIAKASDKSRMVVLTDLMRANVVPEKSSTEWYGAVRFETLLSPSQSAWEDLNWPQGIYGAETGMRQVWLRIELQLMPGEASVANDSDGDRQIPFFGSAALYYEMNK